MYDMNSIMYEMLNLKKWAVIGATQNEKKFGYKIVKKLVDEGFEVTPINPVYDEVLGLKCKKSLKDMDELPECVSMVVAPDKAIEAVKDAIELGIERIWFQPHTFNEEIIALAEENNLKIVYHNCVLVEVSKRL